MKQGDFEADARAVLDEVVRVVLEKNEAYGDSVLNPIRVFSRAGPVEQILVRLDDKLSRIVRGKAAGEDVTLDMLGYLALLDVHYVRYPNDTPIEVMLPTVVSARLAQITNDGDHVRRFQPVLSTLRAHVLQRDGYDIWDLRSDLWGLWDALVRHRVLEMRARRERSQAGEP